MSRKYLIIIAVIIVLIAGYYFFFYRRNGSLSSAPSQTISDQGISVQNGAETDSLTYIKEPDKEKFSVDVYPGAQAKESEIAANFDIPEGKFKTATFFTKDSVQKVVNYYSSAFGGDLGNQQYKAGGVDYYVVYNKNTLKTFIIISSKTSGETQMQIIDQL